MTRASHIGKSEQTTERVAWVLNQRGLGRHQKYSKMHRRRVGAGKTLCGVTIPDAVPSSVGKGECERCASSLLSGGCDHA